MEALDLTAERLRHLQDAFTKAADDSPSRTAVVDVEELAAALDLIEVRSVDALAEIPGLTDRYAQALAALVDAKLHTRQLAGPAEPVRRSQLVDLMDALRKSVREARAERGEAGGTPSPARGTARTAARPWRPRPGPDPGAR
ncbi:hypothetical protein [Streptomyces camelliae]|uniref:DUF222 domain-containing protein n=1 Tax=Streptomyces camelliae TaxID=3004093 RepID=A0ABY7PEE0_9ACTN|nr:hypothetical protein [Streptomyces sp. HUAS 2-6]WBO68993.1 hypothetical protein O1G22_42620 [Streptomyces sp. HUAS 2-6]